jgi:hypothetical protein
MISVNITLDSIDYDGIIEKYVPLLLKSFSESEDSKLRMVSHFPEAHAKAALKALPPDKKEELVVSLLQQSKWKIASFLVGYAEQNEITIGITNIDYQRL